MLKISLENKVRKFLGKLPAKQEHQVVGKIALLAHDSRPFDALPLSGYKGVWRADIGEYRIVYRADDMWLFVLIVGKRNDSDVYKKLRRLLG